jgi:hypothetical protein
LVTDKRILEEGHTAGSYTHNVIDLGGMRMAKGWRKRDAPKCAHRRLVLSASDRLIECDECNQQVDPFDAVLAIYARLDEMMVQVRRDRAHAAEGAASVLVRRAAKELDSAWGHKMAPSCPHCRGGLLPEDFAGGAASSRHRDLEIARRKRAAGNAEAAEDTTDRRS